MLSHTKILLKRPWTIFGAFGLIGLVTVGIVGWKHTPSPNAGAAESPRTSPASEQAVRVELTRPARGGLERTSSQPGSLISYESAELFAKVSGYLKNQFVDIGDRVKRGQVLAEIDSPELDIEVQQLAAELVRSQTEVEQMKARVVTAQAKWKAAVATQSQTEAELARATADRVFRQKQYDRIHELSNLNAIDQRLVDEKQAEMEAARGTEQAAKAAIVTSQADAAAAAAGVEEAKANLANSEAKVQVAQSALARAKVMADYKKIVSPYDGVVSKRSFFRGDFIRGAERGGESPLLVIDRTDRLRVVVQVPDPDVPWVNRGSEATLTIDAIPGEVFSGTVARMADSEDSASRTMRVEIDLPNPTGRLCQGMYGRVTIKLRPDANALVVPASCMVGPVKDGKGSLYVIREGKAHLVPVEIGADDGARIEIRHGLSPEDQVVSHYNGAIGDNVAIHVVSEGREPGARIAG